MQILSQTLRILVHNMNNGDSFFTCMQTHTQQPIIMLAIKFTKITQHTKMMIPLKAVPYANNNYNMPILSSQAITVFTCKIHVKNTKFYTTEMYRKHITAKQKMEMH